MTTTIVTPGESLAEQIERGRDWTCPECGCVFRPGADDVRESMGMTMAYGSRLAIEWYALCPNPDCRTAVKSRWRTAFLDYGPGWAARAYTPARQEPAPWYLLRSQRAYNTSLAVVGFLLAAVTLWVLVMVMQ